MCVCAPLGPGLVSVLVCHHAWQVSACTSDLQLNITVRSAQQMHHVGQRTHKTVIALDLLLLCRLHPHCWKTVPAVLLLPDTAA